MNRRIALNLAFFAVLSLVMVGWMASNVVTVRQVERPYTLRAEFAVTGGVARNAEVTYLGVPIGTVTGVERTTGAVLVSMDIDRGVDIPSGSTANIQRKSAIGEPIVDFRPPADAPSGGPPMPRSSKDFVVPMAQTTVPLELSEVLRSASRLVSSIPPDALATLLRESAIGLEGRADELRGLGDAAEELGTTLASRTETLDRLSQNNTALTRLLADKSGTITSTLQDLDRLAETLREGRGDTNRLLDEGPKFLSETSSLIEATRPDIDCSLDVLGQVIDITARDRKLRELRALLTVGPRAFAGIYDSYDIEPDGAWIRVGLIGTTERPAPQFVPAREVPVSRPPKLCATTVAATPSSTPSGVDQVVPAAAAAPSRPLGTLPATGRDHAPALAGVLAAAAVAARVLLRRTHGPRRA